MWPEKKVTAWDGATGGAHFVELFWQDVKAKRWDDVGKRLAPTFVVTNAGGTYDRAAALERFRTLDIQDFSLGELQVQPSGGDVIVVTYTLALRGSQAGAALSAEPVRAMTVWQQHKDGWLAIAHSTVPAAKP